MGFRQPRLPWKWRADVAIVRTYDPKAEGPLVRQAATGPPFGITSLRHIWLRSGITISYVSAPRDPGLRTQASHDDDKWPGGRTAPASSEARERLRFELESEKTAALTELERSGQRRRDLSHARGEAEDEEKSCELPVRRARSNVRLAEEALESRHETVMLMSTAGRPATSVSIISSKRDLWSDDESNLTDGLLPLLTPCLIDGTGVIGTICRPFYTLAVASREKLVTESAGPWSRAW